MLELNFTPFPQLATSRLLLRKIIPEDVNTFFALRSNENVKRYIDKEAPKNIGEAGAILEQIAKGLNNNDGITWAVCFKENPGTLIGTVGFWRVIKENYRGEIGYMLHPNYWRQGLMEEAVSAAIAYGFNAMKLHSIEAHINPGNTGSAALLEKLNFIREAYFKEDYYYKGRFLDSAIYSLLNK